MTCASPVAKVSGCRISRRTGSVVAGGLVNDETAPLLLPAERKGSVVCAQQKQKRSGETQRLLTKWGGVKEGTKGVTKRLFFTSNWDRHAPPLLCGKPRFLVYH